MPGSSSAMTSFEGISGRRPISTAVTDTKFGKDGKVTDPGHIQFQTSEEERQEMPGLAPAIGHSPNFGQGRRQSVPVNSTLRDGSPFNVTGVRGEAKPSGSDKVIPNPDRLYDHGKASPEQLRTLRDMQEQPIFPKYETSGSDGTNCVSGHAEVANRLGMNVPTPYKHTLPQELGEDMKNKKAGGDSSSGTR